MVAGGGGRVSSRCRGLRGDRPHAVDGKTRRFVRDLLLDTNVLADFFAGDPETVETFQRSRTMSINTVVLGELLGGFALGSRVETNRRLLSRFLSSSTGARSAFGRGDGRALCRCLRATPPQGKAHTLERHVDRGQRSGIRVGAVHSRRPLPGRRRTARGLVAGPATPVASQLRRGRNWPPWRATARSSCGWA